MSDDLTAIDTALASGEATHADPEARALQELALTLAADTPAPRPDFAETLRGRVEAGFPPAKERWRFADLREAFAPLAGVAATILVIVGLVVVLGSGGENSGDSGSSAGAGGGGGEAASGKALSEQSRSGSGFAPGQPNRRIERTFSMELGVPVKEMARVADQVNAVAYRHGGFVLSSSVDSGEGGGSGDFSLRIPVDQLRPALRDLAELAPVKSQSESGRDVTRQHLTAKDRLQAARTERRSLLRRLEAATTDAEAEAIRRRLDIVGGEINGLRSQLRDLRLRTSYAVVNVTLTEAKKDKGSLGSLNDSFDDAGKLLAGFAGVTIRVLALALPLGLIGLIGWLASRSLRRRRRESALA
jgi:hypothetical protein